jgi:hypothetical protein
MGSKNLKLTNKQGVCQSQMNALVHGSIESREGGHIGVNNRSTGLGEGGKRGQS